MRVRGARRRRGARLAVSAHAVAGGLADRLAARTLALVDIPSVSGSEQAVLAAIAEQVPPAFEVLDDADDVLFVAPRVRRVGTPFVRAGRARRHRADRRQRAGPRGRRRDRRARRLGHEGRARGDAGARRRRSNTTSRIYDVGLLFFGREELPYTESALLPLFERCPGRLDARPRDRDGADRQRDRGGVPRQPERHGRRCRGRPPTAPVRGSATTPSTGRSRALAPLADLPVRDVGDRRARLPRGRERHHDRGGRRRQRDPRPGRGHGQLPLRAGADAGGAPRRGCASCWRRRRVEVRIDGNAPPGPVSVSNPLVGALREAGDLAVGPKQAWTPVAEFAVAGVDAVNFGPGDPQYAHRDDERVEVQSLVRCHDDPARVPGARAGRAAATSRKGGRRDAPVSRASAQVEPYPFEELDRRKAEAERRGTGADRLRRRRPARGDRAVHPRRVAGGRRAGLVVPARRGTAGAAAGRGGMGRRRFGADVDPDSQVLPLLGSKEIVFSLAQATLDPAAGKDTVLVTAPGYTIPERGARFAGGDVRRLPLLEANGFLPDLDAVDDATWDARLDPVAQLPEQPDGRGRAARLPAASRRPLPPPRRACSRPTRRTASCGSPGAPPASALQVGDLANVLAINTLSKRSSMTGYRSGFAAGDRELDRGAPTRCVRASASRPRSSCSEPRRGLERRAPRRGQARALRGEAAPVPRAVRSAMGSASRAASPPSTCGSPCPAGARRSSGPSTCSSGPTSSWRPARSSDPKGRGTCAWRWCPPSTECERAVARLEPLLAEVPA